MRIIGDSLGFELIALGAILLLVGWLWLHWDDGPRDNPPRKRGHGILEWFLLEPVFFPVILAVEGVAHGFKNWPKKKAPLATLAGGIGMIVWGIGALVF